MADENQTVEHTETPARPPAAEKPQGTPQVAASADNAEQSQQPTEGRGPRGGRGGGRDGGRGGRGGRDGGRGRRDDRRGNREEDGEELIEKLVHINRVSKTVKGG